MSTSAGLYRIECFVASALGLFDGYGNETFGPERRALCGVVRLVQRSEKSTVRADSSGSRGAAQESVADAVLLFKPIYPVKIDDRIRLGGMTLRVTGVQPRFRITGGLDHNQVECAIWA